MGERVRRWFAIPERKQLAVLLMAAAWISLAALANHDSCTASMALEPPDPSPCSRAVWQTISDSMPAILFGTILFWWFGKRIGEANQDAETEKLGVENRGDSK
jgi:hypothetical protein